MYLRLSISSFLFLQVSCLIALQVLSVLAANKHRGHEAGFLSAASSWFQSKNPLTESNSYLEDSGAVFVNEYDNDAANRRFYPNPHQAEAGSQKSIDRLDRFDQAEDHSHHHHQAVHHESAESKEMSLVYPILLALLVLGALFVPFISLFFYLAVSAFNCQGIGGGFGQVTPIFGRRRRRRRKRELELGLGHPPPMAASTALDQGGNSSFLTTTNDPMSIQVENPITDSAHNLSSSSEAQAGANSSFTFIHQLPRLLLSDSIELAAAAAAASSKGSLMLTNSTSPYSRPEDFLLNDGQLLDEYMFWRRQLARNTIKLREALGAWLELDSPSAAS